MTKNKTRKLVLIGAGKMGGAMLDGWLDKGVDDFQIEVIDPQPTPELEALAAGGAIEFMSAVSQKSFGQGDILVLAVKPQVMSAAVEPLIPVTNPGTLILSIAAGISLEFFEQAFGIKTPVVRAMPNLPASIGHGMTVAVANSNVEAVARDECTELLEAVGKVGWTEKESDIDAVTAVSGSGPAYVFLMIEALASAGESEGLERGLALQIARETVKGAGLLAATSQLSPKILRENVTSPGGTTKAALDVLMKDGGLSDLMDEAVKAATNRSRDLGR
jgi:pyrroline-5-carboxylate reductase